MRSSIRTEVVGALLAAATGTGVASSLASAGNVISGTYLCGVNPAFPMHAQSVYGAFPHGQFINGVDAIGGVQVNSTKSIWPTGLAWRVGTVNQQTGLPHSGSNSGGNGAGSGPYCRNSQNA